MAGTVLAAGHCIYSIGAYAAATSVSDLSIDFPVVESLMLPVVHIAARTRIPLYDIRCRTCRLAVGVCFFLPDVSLRAEMWLSLVGMAEMDDPPARSAVVICITPPRYAGLPSGASRL